VEKRCLRLSITALAQARTIRAGKRSREVKLAKQQTYVFSQPKRRELKGVVVEENTSKDR
jgi:hypothetical protein